MMISDLLPTINAAVARALDRIRLPFRGRLRTLDGARAIPRAMVLGVARETLPQAELMQHFGFSSGVPEGTGCVVLPLLGSSRQAVIVATEGGAARMAVEAGETCIYSQDGAHIALKKGRLIRVVCDDFVIEAANSVRIDAKTLITTAETTQQNSALGHVLATAALSVGGAGGGAAGSGVATINADLRHNGRLITSGDVIARGVSLSDHVHSNVRPGDGASGPPQKA